LTKLKKEYGLDIVDSVKESASVHTKECIDLGKKLLPQLAQVVAIQRGKYYGFDDVPEEYPIFEQCDEILSIISR